MIQRCGTCRFYNLAEEFKADQQNGLEELHPDDYEAECRRYPPARGDAKFYGDLDHGPVMSDKFAFPIVNTLSWCGEWAARPLAASA